MVIDSTKSRGSKNSVIINQQNVSSEASRKSWILSKDYPDPFYNGGKIKTKAKIKKKLSSIRPKAISNIQDPPPLELLGIIGSEINKVAVLKSPKGVIQLKVDDKYDQWILKKIEPLSATFQKDGKQFEIKKS